MSKLDSPALVPWLGSFFLEAQFDLYSKFRLPVSAIGQQPQPCAIVVLARRVGVGIGRRIMAIFEKIGVVSALTGFLVLIGATVALFVAA